VFKYVVQQDSLLQKFSPNIATDISFCDIPGSPTTALIFGGSYRKSSDSIESIVSPLKREFVTLTLTCTKPSPVRCGVEN
jgi:hypothetical protein